jgi:hypothetical protein
MATGWAREGAVLDQIEDTITDGVLTGASTCVTCQSGRDRRVRLVGINRRGSKDSQLR